ncbi:MAG: hypothetical protein RIC80_14550 [Cyclobacteriaceae bacterium]
MSQPVPYHESQVGWLFLSLMSPVLLFLAIAYYQQWGSKPPTAPVFYPTIALLIGVCLLFYRMETSISYRNIKIRYGVGLIKLTPQFDELIAVTVTRIPWWYGVGIRITPKGWLYSIQGLGVVLLTYRKGSLRESIMIGSAKPEELKKSLMENFELKENPIV